MHRFLPAFAMCLAAGCGDEPTQRSDARPRPVDAAPPPPGDARLGVDCLGELCTAEQACCQMVVDPPLHVTFCLPSSPPCEGPAFECDGPEDCASRTCCSPGDGLVRCVDAGACDLYMACHFDDECPPGQRCCDTPAGVIRVCLTVCGG